MKTKNIILSVFALLILVTAAWAADVDGKWVGQTPGRDGAMQETTMTLKADGEKLTGTVTGRMGETAISDGTIKGNAVSFNVVRETPNGNIKIVYTGTLAGDEIKFSRKMEGGPGGGNAVEFTAKRSK